jgi:sorting nexin-1/2
MESVRLGVDTEAFGAQESPRQESVSFGVPPKEISADAGELHIRVSDPDKKGDGMNAYITFKVTTKTTMPTFKNSNPTVERRYNEFLWLHDRLEAQYKGYVIPPLPEKNSLSFNRFTPEFIEYRRKELEKFLRRLAEHPALRKAADLATFL